MANELIINANLPETRIALLEDGEIQDLMIERDSDKGIVGNIYKGKVLRVLPGMQAAFVDIGHEKAAFLYVDDVFFPDMDTPMSTNPLPESYPEDNYPQQQPAVGAVDPELDPTNPVHVAVNEVAGEVNRERGFDRGQRDNRGGRGERGGRFARDNRGGRGGRDNRGGRGGRDNRGGRGGRDNRGGRNDRGGRGQGQGQHGQQRMPGIHVGPPTGGVADSPEAHAAMQRQFGSQMQDISEEEYLAEMEAKRAAMAKSQAAGQTTSPGQPIEDEESIGNQVQAHPQNDQIDYQDDEDFDDQGDEQPVQQAAPQQKVVIKPVTPKAPEAESYSSGAAPEPKQESAPVARSYVPEKTPEAIEDEVEEIEEQDSSAVYRAEPIIDVEAWASELKEAEHEHHIADAEKQSEVQVDASVANTTEEVTEGAVVEAALDAASADEAAPVEQADAGPVIKPVAPGENQGGQPQQRQAREGGGRGGRGRFDRNRGRGGRGRQGHDRSRERDDDEESLGRKKRRGPVNITDLVKEGQEILVQVAKDPIATKGARLTCHVSLPGRYLVFMPSVDHVGVSRRIESDGDRRRLKHMIGAIRPKGTGVIVRTASGKQDDNKLKADLDYLVETWNEIQIKFKKQKPSTVVYQDLNIVLRSIRDIVSDDIDKVIVDSKREFKAVQRFITRLIPNLKDKLELYEGTMPIFDFYGIEPEIERALEKRVWLKSGGYIVVDQAEALVAIDVNTGRYVGKKTLEETILKTNLEAVREIAYQLRLRNCGGIIILDLIDMEKESNRDKVYKALEEELKKDRARPTIMRISQLGLIEMTRKRTRDTMVRALCQTCSHCKGRGFVKSPLTIAYDIMRDMEREGYDPDTTAISIQCHPEVADVLMSEKRDVVENMEHQFNKKISVRSNGAYPLESFELIAHRGDGKNLTLTNEERRQQIRQKITAHLQGRAAEQRQAQKDAAKEKMLEAARARALEHQADGGEYIDPVSGLEDRDAIMDAAMESADRNIEAGAEGREERYGDRGGRGRNDRGGRGGRGRHGRGGRGRDRDNRGPRRAPQGDRPVVEGGHQRHEGDAPADQNFSEQGDSQHEVFVTTAIVSDVDTQMVPPSDVAGDEGAPQDRQARGHDRGDRGGRGRNDRGGRGGRGGRDRGPRQDRGERGPRPDRGERRPPRDDMGASSGGAPKLSRAEMILQKYKSGSTGSGSSGGSEG